MSTRNGDSDERTPNGPAADQPRVRKDTPIISVGGPDGAANRIAQLRATLGRTVDICERVERLVQSRGFDLEARAALIELADHFENNLTSIAQGTGRVLRRLALLE